MTNTVLIKKSSVANGIPTAGQLQPGELAINYADGNLFYKNSGNVVTAIASNKFVSVSGNIQGANLNAVGLSLSGNILSAINSTSNVTTTGNIEVLSGGFFIGDGSKLTGIVASAGAAITNGNSNVSVGANANITVGVTGTANVVVFAPTGEYVTGVISASGNITGANINGNGSGLSSITGANVTGTVANATYAVTAGTAYSVSGANVVGNVADAVHAYFADVANSISGSNVTGQVANALVAGTVYTNAQPNITSVGILSSVSVTGDVTGGNIFTSGELKSTGTFLIGTQAFYPQGSDGFSVNENFNAGNSTVTAYHYTSGTGRSAVVFDVAVTNQFTTGFGATGTAATNQFVQYSENANTTWEWRKNVGISAPNLNGGTLIANINPNGNLYTIGTIVGTGNITGGNLNAAGLSLSSNVVSAINSTSNITTTANIAGGYFLGNGALLSGIITSVANINNGTSNVSIAAPNANITVSVNGTSNVVVFAPTGVSVIGTIAANGTITGGNIAAGSGTISTSGNITGGNLNAAGLSLSSNVLSQINSTSNITTTGNIAGGNIITSGPQGNISGANVISATTFSATGNVTGGNLNAAGLSLSSNVVSALNVTANIAGGNITTPGLISAIGNITTANTLIATGAPATGLTAAVIGNISNVNFHSQSVAAMGGNANGSVQFAFQNYSALANASTDLAIYNNLGTDSTYFIDMGIVSSTYDGQAVGANVFGANDGYLYVVGSSGTGPVGAGANIGNLIIGATNGQVITFLGNTSTGNIITVVGSTGLSVTGVVSATGNITGGNILGGANVNATTHTGATVSVTGNITGGNLNAAGLSLSSNVVSALNASSAIAAGTTINAVGNITGGNLVTAAAVSAASVSASANITGGNLVTSAAVSAASVSASGNITGGNVNTNTIVGTATTIKSTGALNLSATGNITVNSTYINGLLDPVQNQDAATKNYVDTVAAGLHVHQAANLASTSDLATYTGATVTYTQPNGVGNGQGATLSLVGNTLTTLDGTAIPAATTTRLLIKNQANAVLNGVYNYTSSSVLTRSLGEDSGNEFNGGDFLFVLSGATLADTGWVQTTDAVVIGTSNIVFTQFSGAGTYSANTSAGLVLNGTVFSAKTDNITTAFDGTGNIIVKTGAVFTTPSIGAATGTSVSVTGNITSGNLNAAGLSLSSNVISQINSTSNITTTGNISGGNILGGANVNATTHTGTTVSVTGNITGGNLNAAGLSLSSNVISQINSTSNITTTANISGGNIIGTLIATSFSTTGNITAGNLNAAGLSLSSNVISAINSTSNITTTANISGGNILGGANVNATTHTGTTVSVSGTVTGGNIIIGVTGAYFTNGTLNVGVLNAGGGTVPNATTFTGSAVRVSGTIYNSVSDTGTIALATQSWLTGFTVSTAQAPVTYTNLSTLYVAPPLPPTTNVTITNSWAIYSNGAIGTSGLISATGNITGGNVLGGANVNATSLTGTTVSVTGNITGGNLIQGTTRVYKWTTSETAPANPVPGDEWFIGSTGKRYQYWNDGTGNAWVDQSQSTSFDALAVTGNATITGTLTISTGALSVGNITNTNANGVGNIGNSTVYFNTVFAKSTSAQYADLAEIYSADDTYSPGTVVIFGGTKEITVSDISHDTRVAGVISKDPAHLMNSAATGLPVALTGRVLCQVQGPVRKGDILVNVQSGIAGRLDPAQAAWGCVLGKSLENLSGNDVAMIEVVVGRF